MLETSKTTNTTITIDISGKSVVDDETVAQFAAHIDPDEDRISISTVILDKDAYSEQCQEDEAEFEKEVYEAEEQVMDRYEEILGLVNDDDEPDGDDEPGDGGDDPDGDEEKAGDEETIIP